MSKALKGKISYCVKTDRGLCHNVNQDAVAAFVREGLRLFVLSDGMGGHSRGELASRGIIAEFEIYWQKLSEMSYTPDFQTLSGHVRQVIANANSSIYAQYNQGSFSLSGNAKKTGSIFALLHLTCFMRSSSLSRRVSSCFLMRPFI